MTGETASSSALVCYASQESFKSFHVFLLLLVTRFLWIQIIKSKNNHSPFLHLISKFFSISTRLSQNNRLTLVEYVSRHDAPHHYIEACRVSTYSFSHHFLLSSFLTGCTSWESKRTEKMIWCGYDDSRGSLFCLFVGGNSFLSSQPWDIHLFFL